jgi:hypothetical protein
MRVGVLRYYKVNEFIYFRRTPYLRTKNLLKLIHQKQYWSFSSKTSCLVFQKVDGAPKTALILFYRVPKFSEDLCILSGVEPECRSQFGGKVFDRSASRPHKGYAPPRTGLRKEAGS